MSAKKKLTFEDLWNIMSSFLSKRSKKIWITISCIVVILGIGIGCFALYDHYSIAKENEKWRKQQTEQLENNMDMANQHYMQCGILYDSFMECREEKSYRLNDDWEWNTKVINAGRTLKLATQTYDNAVYYYNTNQSENLSNCVQELAGCKSNLLQYVTEIQRK